ncbi:glutamate--tRNA ligase [Acidocella aromatica]|uniref:Glutamate--tRNA ligase n=1 Tax=Acidocella aromatica TaxID=1303579 RepID=A0A840VKI4_9PROT|nr:glutamate--tRNA ligase [Acidocella aromatica]MBB5372010.1 glutamyl-tRNA synthetase [Acidocella aromatica]
MVKVRFAPSPTGYLHVGNARAALVNFLFARNQGGTLLLRLDDTDTERGRPEYEQGIYDDLRWLGISWDETARQSDRFARYAEVAEQLKAAGRLYPCFENEDELAAKRAALVKRKLPPVYDRGALNMTAEQRAAAEANGKTPYWRFKLSDGAAGWNDLVLGPRNIKLGTVSDPVLIRADGTPLYTFTSVVDDADMGITHIIRGEDHVSNTAVQIDLFQAITKSPVPRFAHLPLISGGDGEKLSKRIGSISLKSLRKDGIEPAAITAYLARLGTNKDPAAVPMEELIGSFNLSDFGRSPPRFDAKQMLGLNRKLLHHLEYEAVKDRLPEGATEAFWLAIRGNLDLLTEARRWWEVVNSELPAPELPGNSQVLRAALDTLPAEPWDEETWKSWTGAISEATGAKGRALFQPLRLSLTGEEHGPEMAKLLPLIGRGRVERRLAACVAARGTPG